MRHHPQTPQFTCGHPSLDAASVLLAEFIAARNELAGIKRWLDTCAEEARPTKWTKRIEAAVGKPEELANLRIQHREKSITLACAMLRDRSAWEKAYALADSLRKTVEALVAEYDAIENHSPNAALKPLLRAAVVSIHEQTTGRDEFRRNDEVRNDRALKCLVEAAAAVAEYVNGAHWSPYHYTTELVVDGQKVAKLMRGVDLRNATAVDLREKEPRWVKGAALYALLRAYDAALKGVREASKELRSDNNVNELQHAGRLVDSLYGDTCSARLSQDVVDAQNTRRYDYETARRRVATIVTKFKALHVEVAQALKDAVDEAKAFGALDNSPFMAINQHVIDVRQRAIANIVAADDMLRRYGHEIAEHEKTAGEDLSVGAAPSATDTEFERIAKFSRPRQS